MCWSVPSTDGNRTGVQVEGHNSWHLSCLVVVLTFGLESFLFCQLVSFCLNLTRGSLISIASESTDRPRNSITCAGSSIDFLIFTMNPRHSKRCLTPVTWSRIKSLDSAKSNRSSI